MCQKEFLCTPHWIKAAKEKHSAVLTVPFGFFQQNIEFQKGHYVVIFKNLVIDIQSMQKRSEEMKELGNK